MKLKTWTVVDEAAKRRNEVVRDQLGRIVKLINPHSIWSPGEDPEANGELFTVWLGPDRPLSLMEAIVSIAGEAHFGLNCSEDMARQLRRRRKSNLMRIAAIGMYIVQEDAGRRHHFPDDDHEIAAGLQAWEANHPLEVVDAMMHCYEHYRDLPVPTITQGCWDGVEDERRLNEQLEARYQAKMARYEARRTAWKEAQ